MQNDRQTIPWGQEVLLIDSREAAKALSICQRKLFQLTKEGKIKRVKIGVRVLYDPRDLIDFVDAQKGVPDDADQPRRRCSPDGAASSDE